MKERIKQIMDRENLTPSLFADKLNIGRAVVSHLLNGRNNPSLDVVIRILETFENINADWLLSGAGQMLKDVEYSSINKAIESIGSSTAMPQDLFSTANKGDTTINIPKNIVEPIVTDTKVVNKIEDTSQIPINKEYTYVNRTISKIIIYYSDNTFQAFNPDMKPL